MFNFSSECAEDLFSYVVSDASIEWPSDEDWHIDVEAKNLITGLLIQDPQERLGSQGPQEVKEHPYLNGIEWNSLLRYKVYISIYLFIQSNNFIDPKLIHKF